MADKTNVIEWPRRGEEDIMWAYPHTDIRFGSQVVVREYEACVFMRDGKVYDVFLPGRHVITTANVPMLTGAFNKLAGYGETPFKVDIVFVSLRQHRGKFGLNMRMPMSKTYLAWMTEVQTYGEFYFKIDDPVVFLTQLAGGLSEVSSVDVSAFVRNFFVQGSIQELSRHDVITVQTKLQDVTVKLRATLMEQFRNRGLTLLEAKFGGFTFPYLEKLEKEDPTYGVPLMAAMQSGQSDKALDIIKIVESMRGIGQSSGAGIGAGLVGIPYLFGQGGAPGAPPVYGGTAPQGAAPSAPALSIEDRLLKLKDLLDKGLISEEEYQEKRKKYLEEL